MRWGEPLKLIVFTDLDGTLLDHGDYSFAAARPALAALAKRAIPVIPATSKTAAEIGPIREALGLQRWPAIVENGAAIVRPGDAASENALDYERLRATLDALPDEVRRGFRGFGDMTIAEIAGITGLGHDEAALARQRVFSEPGLFAGGAKEEARFVALLAKNGVTARRGGRFLTLSFGGTKADRTSELAEAFGPALTLALGDAPNDVEMLEAADLGVIIRNDHGPELPELPGERAGRITRSALPGPAGWNRAVLDLLSAQEQKGGRG